MFSLGASALVVAARRLAAGQGTRPPETSVVLRRKTGGHSSAHCPTVSTAARGSEGATRFQRSRGASGGSFLKGVDDALLKVLWAGVTAGRWPGRARPGLAVGIDVGLLVRRDLIGPTCGLRKDPEGGSPSRACGFRSSRPPSRRVAEARSGGRRRSRRRRPSTAAGSRRARRRARRAARPARSDTGRSGGPPRSRRPSFRPGKRRGRES